MSFSKNIRLGGGFTLLELLVAIAVMGLLLVLLLQVSSQALQATRASRSKIESDRRARVVLDSLAADFASRVTGENFPVFVRQQGGDLEMAFLTRSRGPAGASDFRFLAVAYELKKGQMLRKTTEVTWSQADLVQPVLDALMAEDGKVLSEGILRVEASAVLTDGGVVPLDSGTEVDWLSSNWLGTELPEGYRALLLPRTDSSGVKAEALIVGVAGVDLSNWDRLEAIGVSAKSLLPVVTENQTPADLWNGILLEENSLGVPASILSALALSQQIFSLR